MLPIAEQVDLQSVAWYSAFRGGTAERNKCHLTDNTQGGGKKLLMNTVITRLPAINPNGFSSQRHV